MTILINKNIKNIFENFHISDYVLFILTLNLFNNINNKVNCILNMMKIVYICHLTLKLNVNKNILFSSCLILT